MQRLLSITLLVCALIVSVVLAEDWPNWRGPSRDGVSTETGLPLKWGDDENIAWKIEMPAWSGSTPIIWGDMIFINVAEGGKRVTQRRGRRRGAGGGQAPQAAPQPEEAPDPNADRLGLWALDRKTGAVIWKRALGGGNRQLRKQNMSSPSPVTDGQHVWVMTGTGVLQALDFKGNEVWNRNIQDDYGRFGLNWGYASSPLLYEDSLYVEVLHGMKTDDPSYVLRIDKATGKTKWRVERPTDAINESPDSYTTPAVAMINGTTELIITGGDYVTGHDLDTGEELWRAGGLNPEKARNYRIVASPVVLGELVFVPSRKNPLQAFRVGGRGDVTESHRVWQTRAGPDVPTPVTDGKYLYILDDRGIMSCLNARTGEVIWEQQRVRPGTYSASPVLADGRIYVTSEDGVTTVIEAGAEFKVLAENELNGYTLSSPAVSGGQIFVRTESHLFCIGKGSE